MLRESKWASESSETKARETFAFSVCSQTNFFFFKKKRFANYSRSRTSANHLLYLYLYPNLIQSLFVDIDRLAKYSKQKSFFFFFFLLLLPLPFKVKCCMYHSTCGCIGFLIATKAEKSAKVSQVVKWAFYLIMFLNKLLTCLF